MEKNIKVYFEETSDIRRFLLRAPTSLEQFKQLQEMLKPFVNEKTGWHIFYKDEENDFVTLSNAQEFEVCVACPNNRDILRVYVRNKPTAAISSANAAVNNSVWQEVTCDKCTSSPLNGIRYRCTVCADYDECGKCFNSNPQHVHAMIALTDPHSNEWKFWSRRGGRHAQSPYGSPREHRQHHGLRRHQRDEAGADNSSSGGHATGRSMADWLELAKASASYAQQQFGGKTEIAGASATVGAENLSNDVAASSIPGVSFTTCEGGHPKVEVDVDMNDLIRQPRNVFETVFRAVEEAGKMFQSMAAPISSEKPLQQQISTSSQTSAVVQKDKQEGTSDAGAAIHQQDAEMNDNASVVVDVFLNENQLHQLQKYSEIPMMSESVQYVGTVPAPARAEPTAPNGWTLLSGADEKKADRKKETEDMVNACIESMKDLGFDTEKPWIRDLVTGCEGNLSRVLDELAPTGSNSNM